MIISWIVGLKTLKVGKDEQCHMAYKLTEEEICLFKRLVKIISGMDRVTISNLYVSLIYLLICS